MTISKLPYVDVVIPLYNTEHYIIQALQSIERQTIRPTNVYIIDDGSTDKGVDIVRSYIASSQLTIHLYTTKNQGPSHARNVGVEKSKADYIAFLDADDMWQDTYLEQQLGALQKTKHACSFSNHTYIDRLGHLAHVSAHTFKPVQKPVTIEDLIAFHYGEITPSTLMFSRQALTKITGFNPLFKTFEDADLLIRFYSTGYTATYTPQALCLKRVHSQNTISNPIAMLEGAMLYATTHLIPAKNNTGLKNLRKTICWYFISATKAGKIHKLTKTYVTNNSDVKRKIFPVFHSPLPWIIWYICTIVIPKKIFFLVKRFYGY